jgi:hypothetical protein
MAFIFTVTFTLCTLGIDLDSKILIVKEDQYMDEVVIVNMALGPWLLVFRRS